jgi:nucleoside 2-deoxyribosyltransferase
MKIYFAIKYHSDHQNRPKIEYVSNVLENLGCRVTCITRDIENWGQESFCPEVLMKMTFEIIDSSDLVLIDLTEKGVGLGIEAGYAFSKSKPIITISEKQEISTTLNGISNRCLVYENESELFEFFEKELINQNLTNASG